MSILRNHAGNAVYSDLQTVDAMAEQILNGDIALQDLPDSVIEDLAAVLTARIHDRSAGGPDPLACKDLVAAIVRTHIDAAIRLANGRLSDAGPVNLYQASRFASHLLDIHHREIYDALNELCETSTGEAA